MKGLESWPVRREFSPLRWRLLYAALATASLSFAYLSIAACDKKLSPNLETLRTATRNAVSTACLAATSIQPKKEAVWPLGSLHLSTYSDAVDRWQGLLKALYPFVEEQGCPSDYAIIRQGRAIASFEDLALLQDLPTSRPHRDLRNLGLQTVVLSVSNSTDRQERLRHGLAAEGITDFLWQLGWDVSDLPANADTIRKLLWDKLGDDVLASPVTSLTMKQLMSLSDFINATSHPASYYVSSKQPGNRLSKSIPLQNKDLPKPKYLLLLEDDAKLVPNFYQRLETLMQTMPENFSMLSLGACCNEHAPTIHTDYPDDHRRRTIGAFSFDFEVSPTALEREWRWMRCTGANLIHPDYIKQILEGFVVASTNRTDLYPIDIEYNTRLGEQPDDLKKAAPFFWAEPPLVHQSTKAVNNDQGTMGSSLRWNGV